MSKSAPDTERELNDFYQEADQRHLIPLWKVTAQLLPSTTSTRKRTSGI